MKTQKLTDQQRDEVARLVWQQQVEHYDLGKLMQWRRSTNDPRDVSAIDSILAKHPSRAQKAAVVGTPDPMGLVRAPRAKQQAAGKRLEDGIVEESQRVSRGGGARESAQCGTQPNGTARCWRETALTCTFACRSVPAGQARRDF